MGEAEKIKKEALAKIAILTTAQICKAYEDTNTMEGDHVPDLRDWYMYALEERNEAAFIAWMETEDVELMDKPSVFFI